MTAYSITKYQYYNNRNGIIDYVMAFSIKDKIRSNTRLYFYKYDLHDVIEIEYRDGIMHMFTFRSEEDVYFIKDNIEFYAGYFKSAGLEGKRFLFDVSLKMPVSYADFVEMDTLPNITNDSFLFTLDRHGTYVTERGCVLMFVSTTRLINIDKCVLALTNDLINVKDPKSIELAGTMSATIISGLLSGVGINDILRETQDCDTDYKFKKNVIDTDISSANIMKIKSKLKLTKFDRILKGLKQPDKVIEGIVKLPEKGTVELREMVEAGVDRFIKMFCEETESWKVIIDIPMMQNMIRSAHIWKGILYIVPMSVNADVKYFREFLDSDNIELVTN